MDNRPEPVAAASALVAEMFDSAVWAVVSGSVITSARTPGSDLDIVVRLADDEAGAARRESLRWCGWPVELFVHSGETLHHYLNSDVDRRRPVLVRMIATGHLLKDRDGLGAREMRRCRAILDAGPSPLPVESRDLTRYALTDQIEDVRSAIDPDERVVSAAALWQASAVAFLDAGPRWRGAGKWLLRELIEADAAFAQRWLDARDEPLAVCAVAEEVVEKLGGPLFEGYRVGAATE